MSTPTSPHGLVAALGAVPDAAAQMSWITDVVAHGVRRPGSGAGDAVEAWCAAQLEAIGCDVTLQPLETLTSHPEPAVVAAWPRGRPHERWKFDGLTMPFSTATGPGGRRFSLVRHADDGSGAGHAVLFPAEFVDLPVDVLDAAIIARHGDGLAGHVHTLPFGPALGKEIDAAIAGGAAAMIGVVAAPWTTHEYFVPYDGRVRDLPAVWLDRRAGAALDALLDDGPVDIELVTTVVNRLSAVRNVIGTLDGPGDEWIVVGSHHDAPWASAVEDGTGIAQVLAQATAWAAVPPAQRPAKLAFLLTAAHMSDGAGTRAFLREWPHRDRIAFGLHLEHVASRATPDGEGGLVDTGEPEVRWWFVSGGAHDEALAAATIEAITGEGLDWSLVMPPDVFSPMPPTDGGFYHPAGIPMVNLLAAPMYLFDPRDRIDLVHVPSLVPTARAAARLVAGAPSVLSFGTHR